VSRRLGALLAFPVVLLAACAAGSTSGISAPHGVTVFAAASLRDAMGELATAYQAAGNPALTVSFDSSAALRTQIEQGAPADVLAAADMDNPQRLAAGGHGIRPVVAFATNRLVIVVPADNPASIGSPEDLARDGVRIVAAGEEVPISRYAHEAVTALSGLSGYPADYAAAVDANVVSREDNVRAVLAKVELGEADAAFVYATDARASDAVQVVEVPDEAQVPATYGAVVVASSPRREAAVEFLDWLTGEAGRATMARHGFGPPPGS
jgi:molybdate transport system substrate-binding protein